ncbi:MAG: Alanine racemase 1 [candidate division WS2 bacterium]|nr:Alanine racemase 1 [Candidatus Psychracetigena formicireducens]
MLSVEPILRNTWAEIDLGKIKTNLIKVKAILKPNTKLIAVVKGNAYGHGAPIIAQAMEKAGADMFGVVTIGEAMDLINYGITRPIIVFGYTPPEAARLVIQNDIRVTLFDERLLQSLVKESPKIGKKALVHIEIETGLTRWGLNPESVVSFIKKASVFREIEIEGIYSHLATADEENKDYAYQQFELFNKTLGLIEKAGVYIPIKHIANASATVDLPETHLDAVRPGIILYGYEPSTVVLNSAGVEPALQLKSRVGRVYKIEAGSSVSYGRSWIAEKSSKIATLPIGYADGYRRELSNKGKVLIRGTKLTVAGRVNMDTLMVDVSPVESIVEGDEGVIIGTQGKETLWADEIASLLGTNANEVLVNIGHRIPRLYFEEGKLISTLSPMGGYYSKK